MIKFKKKWINLNWIKHEFYLKMWLVCLVLGRDQSGSGSGWERRKLEGRITDRRGTEGPSGRLPRSSEAWTGSGRRPRPGKWPWWCHPAPRNDGADAADRWRRSETTIPDPRSTACITSLSSYFFVSLSHFF